jgi:hypothetical protein
MSEVKNPWVDFFNSPLGSSEIEVFLGEGLRVKLLVHPGDDDKTMYLSFDQNYEHYTTDSGICVGIEEAQELIKIFQGLVLSRGISCNSCDEIMHNPYISDDRGDFCWKCAQNEQ